MEYNFAPQLLEDFTCLSGDVLTDEYGFDERAHYVGIMEPAHSHMEVNVWCIDVETALRVARALGILRSIEAKEGASWP